MLGIEK